jgi:hypothetical protein
MVDNKIIENAKKFADKLINTSQGLLCKDGFLAPMVFSVSSEGVTPILLEIKNDSDKDSISEKLKELSEESDFIFMVMDSYVRSLSKGANIEISKDDPDSIESIVGLLYLKDATFMRNMTYKKNEEENRYNFFDQGWEDLTSITSCGRFSNPYLKE